MPSSTFTDFGRYDIYTAWKALQPPHFDLLAPTQYSISLRSHKPDNTATKLLQTLTTGFRDLASNDYTNLNQILEVVNHASIFSADFDQLMRTYNISKKARTDQMLNVSLVRFTRWCVLHDMLMLPSVDIDTDSRPEQVVYEVCRNILLAYALFVFVPLPTKCGVHMRIANSLNQLLSVAVEIELHVKHPDLFLCAVSWAWMCAHNNNGSRKLDQLLQNFLGYVEWTDLKVVMHEWPVIADTMKSFLWLQTCCNEAGLKYWACACGMKLARLRDG